MLIFNTLLFLGLVFFHSLWPLSCAHGHSTHMITVHARAHVCMCTLPAPAHESLYITWWIRLFTHVCISNHAHSYIRTYTIYHFRQTWLYRRIHTLCVLTDVHMRLGAHARLKIVFFLINDTLLVTSLHSVRKYIREFVAYYVTHWHDSRM